MKKKIRKTKSLSLVIPCHNEEGIISLTIKKYYKILKKLKEEKKITSFNILIVNNGSTDNTLSVVLEERKKFPLKIVNLKKNFGYTSSYLAGMFHAEKDLIITVSADMHEDPNKIIQLIKKHNLTNKPVLGIYKKRHDKFLKNFFSKFYYKFMNLIKIQIIENHADFRLITKDINKKFFYNLPTFVFIRIRMNDFIKKYESVFYVGNNRKIGKTKFNFLSSALLAVDTILYYSKISISKIFLNLFLFFFVLTIILILSLNLTYLSIFSSLISLIFISLFIFSNKRLAYLKLKKKHFLVKNIY